MDIATIFGFIATFGLFLGSILMGGSIMTFVNLPGLMVVVGGTIGVGFINYPVKRLLSAFSIAKNAFTYDTPDLKEQNEMIVDLFANGPLRQVLFLKPMAIMTSFAEKHQNHPSIHYPRKPHGLFR